MTLQEITQRISDAQRLSVKNPSAALVENRRLFVDLARRDEVYIVPDAVVSDDAILQKRFRPYIAPAQPNDTRLFLRIFSHEDAALSFAEKNQHRLVSKLDGVELMQLAKFHFLRGVYGFLLNDGLAWAAISFPDFLTDCFVEILGDKSLFRPEYIALIQLINMIRQNDCYQIVVARQEVKTASEPEKLFFMDQARKSRFSAADFIVEDLSPTKLLQYSTIGEDAHISIRTEKVNCSVSSDMLRAAFFATGLNRFEDGSFNTELDFHVESIALDFGFQDFISRDGVIPSQFQLAGLPSPHDNAPGEKKAPHSSSKSDGWLSGLAKRIKQHRANKAAHRASKKNPESFASPEGKGEKHRKLSPALLIKIAMFVVLIAVVGIATVFLLEPSPKTLLMEQIEVGEYSNVNSLYGECLVKNPGDEAALVEFMYNDLAMRLDAYAAGSGSADSLAAAISEYGKIPAMKESTAACFEKAKILELSKNTYEKGLQELSVLARLDTWRGLSKLDIGSQQQLSKNLTSNAAEYKAAVFLETGDMQLVAALSGLMLLQSYYPTDADISSRIQSLQRSTEQPSNSTSSSTGSSLFPALPGEAQKPPGEIERPISIQRLACKPFGIDGRMDLYIDWTNVSGKQIQKVDFEVLPFNRRGERVSIKDQVSGDSVFLRYVASDVGPFDNGYITPSKHVWEAAWKNSSIETVVIDRVYIFFVGEEIPLSITNPEEIATLFGA